MFLNHFKMNDHPFQERPPVEWILNDNRISESLARLDYFAQQGTLALLIGQTGVGKSTLLRVLAGLLTPDEGSVSSSMQKGMRGYAGSSFDLYTDLTVSENLDFFGRRQVLVQAPAAAQGELQAVAFHGPGGQAPLSAVMVSRHGLSALCSPLAQRNWRFQGCQASSFQQISSFLLWSAHAMLLPRGVIYGVPLLTMAGRYRFHGNL